MNKKRCVSCGDPFTCTEKDLQFYQRHDLPTPHRCPDCRQLRRVRQINQTRLFKRVCDATGVSLVSNHPLYVSYPVFSQEHWYTDAVDNTKFGQEIDFSQSFFEQFAELNGVVPKPSLFTDFTRDENCAYTNYAGKNKNCYLIFDSDENWDCLCSYGINSSKNSSDCYRGDKLELCLETIDCERCFNCHHLQNCQVCSDSAYLRNCIGVKNSFFCANLYQKEGYVLNKKASPEELKSVKNAFSNPQELSRYLERFEQLVSSLPERAIQGIQNEECIGNYLSHCKNAYYCFDCREAWDCSYLYQAFMPVKDSMDCHEVGGGELLYECADLGYNAYNCKFTMNCLNQITNLTYCNYCFLGSNNLFGCIGLKRRSFCILNTQYTEVEYKKLSQKLINHMKETGEWGEFFPVEISPFAYNHSLAQQFYPLTQSEAEGSHINWHVEETITAKTKRDPEILECEICHGPYKVIGPEKDLYKQLNQNLPTRCFHCRHQERLSKRAPRILLSSRCDNCSQEIMTPPRKHSKQVFCEKCFSESRT